MNRLLAGLLAAVLAAASARADDGPVTIELAPKTVSLSPGGEAAIRVLVRIESPYHVCAPEAQIGADGSGPSPTQLAVKTKDVISLDGPLKTSPPAKRFDPNLGMDVPTLEGDAWIETAIKAGASLKPGKYTVVLTINYQACNDTNCLMPQDAEASFELEIRAPAQAAEPAAPPSEAGSKSGG
jgi:hypothetical protein